MRKIDQSKNEVYEEDIHRKNQDHIIMAWQVFLVGNIGMTENARRHLMDSLRRYKEEYKDRRPMHSYKFDHV